MKIGCCAPIEKVESLYRAGFDFIECPVGSVSPEESDRYFKENILTKFRESPLPIEAFNVFLPGHLKVTGDSVDRKAIDKYLDVALERLDTIGAKIVVFGSGGARSLPEHFDREKGEAQIVDFLHLVADKADQTDITVVIEPLNKKESNIINSVTEAVAFAKKVDRSSIQVLADFYHMDEDNEPLDNIFTARDFLRHVHVADTGRLAPGTGSYPYQEFVKQLKAANYNDRVSIECSWHEFEQELGQAKQFLDQVLNG